MILVISIIFCLVFFSLFSKQIKRFSIAFYAIALLIIIGIIYANSIGFFETMPKNVYRYAIGPFVRGGIAVATFTIVMYLGILNKKSFFYKKLMPIRGQLSVFGCLFSLFHNLAYGVYYFPKFFTNIEALNTIQVVATVISLVAIVMMMPLFITSFQSIRVKMPAKKWKNIQRLAYPFYGLLYVHVMVIFANNIERHYLNILIYTIVFGFYGIARIKKANINARTIRQKVA